MIKPAAAPTVTPRPVPKTGDTATPLLWLVVIVLGLLGICGAGVRIARKRK